MNLSSSWRRAAVDALSWLIPVVCAGCGEPDVALCDRCDGWLRSSPIRHRWLDGLSVVSAADYDGPLVGILRAFKADGRTALARPLGAALARGVQAGLDRWQRSPSSQAHAASFLAVPIPTSAAAYRRRGYRTVELLARRSGLTCVPLLRADPRAVDQRTLGREDRARNATGMFRLAGPGADPGVPVVLLDDVVTTGATLSAAARVVESAGMRLLGAVTVASTPLRASLSEPRK